MKTNAVIIGTSDSCRTQLARLLESYWPGLSLLPQLRSVEDLLRISLADLPSLIFLDSSQSNNNKLKEIVSLADTSEIVLICKDSYDRPLEAIHELKAIAYIQQPIRKGLLRLSLFMIKNLLMSRPGKKHESLIAIPSSDGLEFVRVEDIVRCESLINCTKLVLASAQKSLLSSYNIGEFRRMLEPYGFFCPHKSHLVNLNRVLRYRREGVITMQSDADFEVPVARAKRNDFLSRFKRL